ncbi:cytochrome c [Candidatus Endoriftia persephonae]|uniref:Cytochrome c n=2 Tax=Gammaproteobacteria TaxID=1236 RepID=A0A9J7A0N4_9GAMM|nr:cytochrome c [Candidatus Endoriftia persephone]EGW55235.1 putative secreted protein [endosymbiont of Tevnia jerichonana (vent Tica)]USF88678.1 cytochrome c [Candidatus Endoriftia persephone]
MRAHIKMNMRDHMVALTDARTRVATEAWDQTSERIEQRIGMSSMESYGASHMTPLMPAAMRELGTAMHHEASRLSRTLVETDPQKVMAGFVALTKRCGACHAGFRVQ